MSVMDWISGRVFTFVHGNNLVYNTCWEDPRLDRVALDIGADDYNQWLSERRANAVRDMLINDHGIPAEQLVAIGRGETMPIASNDTAEGRAQNRRVELVMDVAP